MDRIFMEKARQLSLLGKGSVAPNPLVGALVVKDEKILSQGYHAYFGGFHAEVMALNEAGIEAEGGTLYVTLEPCCHWGKQPPCVEAIVEAGIKKVVIGIRDPNPKVNGAGVEYLKSHGILVVEGLLEEAISWDNRFFIHHQRTGLPYVILKNALSLDGKMATSSGDSKWISNESSRAKVHQLRHEVSAIVVGIGTVLKDNPELTARIPEGINPQPIVIDSQGKMPLYAKLMNLGTPPIIATTERIKKDQKKLLESKGAQVWVFDSIEGKVPLKKVLEVLGKKDYNSLLVEGGETLKNQIIKEDLVQQAYFFIGNKLIGGKTTMDEVKGLKNINVEMLENDFLIEGCF